MGSYDPSAYHDRLLLGLSGIMSEAELHQIQLRLHQGERQKAARGELRLPLPAGLSRERGGGIILNPDEELQERLRLVFVKFTELQSARAVMRYLRVHDLPLPVRPLLGPAPHEVAWREANSARVRSILQNPAYAGAYVYGRRRPDPVRRRSGARAATTKVAVGAWEVCLPAAFPGYLSWEEFMANQRRLADNVNRYAAGHHGVPRRGHALLQGIAACGRCGRRMSLRYTGPKGDYPVYCCRADRDQGAAPLCQEVRALPVDAFVARTLLEALAPDRIAIAVAAVGQLQEEARQLDKQWGLRRERARYEAERARRQYDAVEPENRLVARSLERTWEEKLRAVEATEQAYEQWRREEPLVLSEADHAALQTLGEDLPRVWHAATKGPSLACAFTRLGLPTRPAGVVPADQEAGVAVHRRRPQPLSKDAHRARDQTVVPPCRAPAIARWPNRQAGSAARPTAAGYQPCDGAGEGETRHGRADAAGRCASCG